MYVLTAENMKKAENAAFENGLSYYDMMKRAGIGCAEKISAECTAKKTVILSGKGRNGGDGLVVAAELWRRGFTDIKVVLVHGMPTDKLCLEMYNEMVRYPVDVTDCTTDPDTALYHISTADIIVESVFGIGFRGTLDSTSAKLAEPVNSSKAKKYAVDIPGGLTADGIYNGKLYFHADITLSMIAYKPVHILKPTSTLCGKTEIIDIGIGKDIISSFSENYTCYTKQEALAKIKPRRFDANKGDFGKILTVSGNRCMTGCVKLLNRAAAEMGAGLITAAFPDCIYNTVTSALTEPVFMPLASDENGFISGYAQYLTEEKLKTFDAIAIGCGMGVTEKTKKLTQYIIRNAKYTVILDADAINCVAENPDILRNTLCDIILTPHPGEMARLTKRTVAEVQNDRIGAAVDFATDYGVTLLLKGANTVVADKNGRLFINTTGNPGMARGGSGDALTGIIAALVPQTDTPFEAAAAGAYIHGDAGDFIMEKYGILAPTPSRLIENLHNVIVMC